MILLHVTLLVSSGEHILLFLAKTVARQGTEQGQYVSNKSSDSKSRSANARSIGTPTLPAHDLEPPKFAKLALEHTLKDWRALRSMLMFGSNVDQVKSRLFIALILNILLKLTYNNLPYSSLFNYRLFFDLLLKKYQFSVYLVNSCKLEKFVL